MAVSEHYDGSKYARSWFPEYVVGMVTMYDYEVYLERLTIQLRTVELSPPDGEVQTTLAASRVELQEAKDRLNNMLSRELEIAKTANTEAKGTAAQTRAKHGLDWVQGFMDRCQKSFPAEDQSLSAITELPQYQPYYKELSDEQKRLFWQDESRFGIDVACRWLQFLEPAVNVKASLEQSKIFYLITKARWSFAAKALWDICLAPDVTCDPRKFYATVRKFNVELGTETEDDSDIEMLLLPEDTRGKCGLGYKRPRAGSEELHEVSDEFQDENLQDGRSHKNQK